MGELVALGAKLPKKAASGAGSAADLVAFYDGFPIRWMAFLRAHFAGPEHVAGFFGVSERAARKWWEGAGGVNGGKVALACTTIPTAALMLFAAE